MSLKNITAGDYGYVIEMTFKDVDDGLPEDLQAFTTKQYIHIRKPDSTFLELAGSFSGNGSDGKVKVTVAAGDIPASWTETKSAARIRCTSGSAQITSDWEEFTFL